VERFAYRIVSDASDPVEVVEAQTILRIAVGLRRKLDRWKADVNDVLEKGP